MSQIELFHYVHCPYCVRVRMGLGYLKIPFKSTVLRYDDESTPIQMTGKKQAPFIRHNGIIMNESLDILHYADKEKFFKIKDSSMPEKLAEMETALDLLSKDVHSLCMPYWIYTPEFDEKSRAYFVEKKSKKRGPFNKLVHDRNNFEEKLNKNLSLIEQELKPFYKNDQFSIFDIMLAGHLWGLYVLPEFQFSDKIHQYLMKIKNICNFNYHEDFWRLT